METLKVKKVSKESLKNVRGGTRIVDGWGEYCAQASADDPLCAGH